MYRIRDSGKRLELVHRTPVGGVPGCISAAPSSTDSCVFPCPPEVYLRVYRIRDSGKRLELVHRTPVGGVRAASVHYFLALITLSFPARQRATCACTASATAASAWSWCTARRWAACRARWRPSEAACSPAWAPRCASTRRARRSCCASASTASCPRTSRRCTRSATASTWATCRRAPGPAHPLLVGRLPPALAPLMRHRLISAHIGEGAF